MSFSVRDDSSRVRASDSESTASGTDTVVLGAGDQAQLADGGRTVTLRQQPLSQDEVNRLLAWREGRLVFTGQTLAEVVAEFNRYNVGQLVISEETIADVKIEGSFQARDLEGFLSFLQVQHGITAKASNTGAGRAQVIGLSGPRVAKDSKKKPF
jgi:transmembrane sensor